LAYALSLYRSLLFTPNPKSALYSKSANIFINLLTSVGIPFSISLSLNFSEIKPESAEAELVVPWAYLSATAAYENGLGCDKYCTVAPNYNF